MSNERLKTLLINSLIFLDTEFLSSIIDSDDSDQVIKFLKDEIGFNDDEIEELDIVNIIISESNEMQTEQTLVCPVRCIKEDKQ